ncbi:MAG: UvrD-helicase domain-containing protein [Clostridia bacterium]|nr:UvrD-helicase domain-containing protein [Clostridia bacterium]
MSDRKPNSDQEKAIKSNAPDILVSASAGTGKTDVLVGRIMRLIGEERYGIDDFLVVTFTVAAAAEMRERIEKSIDERIRSDKEKARFWKEQKRRLSYAAIKTIDGFCLDVLKENFVHAGLTPGVKTAESSEIAPLRRRILDEVLRETDREDADFAIESISDGKNDFYDTANRLYDLLVSRKEGLGAFDNTLAELEKAESEGLLGTIWGKEYLASRAKDLDFFAEMYGGFYEEAAEVPGLEKAAEYFNAMRSRAERLAELCRETAERPLKAEDIATEVGIIKNSTVKKFSRSSKIEKEYYKAGDEREAAFESVNALFGDACKSLNNCINLAAANEADGTIVACSSLIKTLRDLLERFDRRFREEKEARGILEFSDFQRRVYDLLKNHPEVAHEVALKYPVMFIDEYQDVSPLQDGIFGLLREAGAERFMVGDAKQCIYAFRGSDPAIFDKYRNGSVPGISREYLRINYRSTWNIMRFANDVSGPQLSACDGTEYDKENDDLRNPESNKDGVSVVRRAISLDGTENAVPLAAEASCIVAEMTRLNREERVPFSDMAVLLRKNAPSRYYEDALEKAGISVSNVTSQNPLDSPEVILAISLLNVVNNPSNDVHVAAVMRSPLFGFTLTDLVRLRTPFYGEKGLFERVKFYPGTDGADPELAAKCRAFTSKIADFGKWSALPVGDLLWNLYTETGMLSVGSMKTSDAEGKKTNLIAFHDFAVRFESGRYRGLYNFVDHVNEMVAGNDALKQTYSPPDCVTIMTAHKSKGLGMNVVFLAGLRESTGSNQKARCFVDGNGLIVSRIADRENYANKDLFIYNCDAEARKERDLSEELRLLYVMLTRAKKRLYLYVTDNNKGQLEKKLEADSAIISVAKDKKLARAFIMKNAKSHAELISAVMPEAFRFEKFVRPEKNAGDAVTNPPSDPEIVSELKKRLLSDDPFAGVIQLPTKLAVTSLSAKLFDGDGYQEVPVFSADAAVPDIAKEKEQGGSGAEKGSATHAFMQFCDFRNLSENGFENELRRQTDGCFISRESAALVDEKTVEDFTHSKLFGRILSTPDDKIWREYRFFVFLPASEFARQDKKEALKDRDVLVQGAIDLLIEEDDGSLTIVDYKTDARRRGEGDRELAARLADKHSAQLSYYRRAAEEVFRKPVNRTVIYSFALGGEIDVDTKIKGTESGKDA